MSLIEKEMYEFGPYSLDPAERVILRGGERLSLTPKVFDTLVCLVRNGGRLLTKDELLKEIWPDTFVEEVNLAVNISTLRKAFGEGPQDARYIATVPGRGYRFVADVQKARGNGSEQNSTMGKGSAMAFRGEPGLLEQGSGELRDQEPDGVGRFVVAPSPAKKNRPWNLTAVLVGIALLLAVAICSYLLVEQRRKDTSAVTAPSIAVLPFADLSPGRDQEYLSDGLAAELINYLAKVPGVRVVARSSSFQFKGKNEDLRAVGKKLGVTNILEGSVQRQGDRVRIMAELIKVDDGFQLWSETYDPQIGDIFSVQDEIARAVTGALQVKLLEAKGTALSAHTRSTNLGAYQAFLQAQFFFGRGESKTNLDKALAYADQAIKLDPKYAPAWALRSCVLNVIADFALIERAQAYREARENAEHAIALNPNLATGYLALGWTQMSYDWDWERAEISLAKAAELQPGSADLLYCRSLLFELLGRLPEAIEMQKQAIAVDPLQAKSYSRLGYQLYFAGRYDEADNALKQALELNPQKEQDHITRGEILLARGRPQRALDEIEQESDKDWKLFGEALAYHSLGKPNESDAALKQLIADGQNEWACQIAQVYAYRDDPDSAFAWLDRAYRQHDSGLTFMEVDSILKRLRPDQRYAELLKRLRLPT